MQKNHVPRYSRLFGMISIFLLVASLCFAQEKASGSTTKLHAEESDLQWFRDAKFGMFVHWGPVSLQGTEIGWSRAGERKFPNSKGTEVPVEIYDNLYQEFNPVKFNAKEWVRIAQNAGMKYLVFTTKHHDGFCMFDSQLSDYKITHTPFGRDVVRELADACHDAGLRLGFYYSPPDWHHPDYFTENHPRYLDYFHGQVRELCTNYGKVSILWFDGLGGTAENWGSYEMIPMIYQLQPGILINNRAGLPCDYDTPEQRVGTFQNTRAWETCMTLCRQWSWKPDDQLKSLQECIDILVRSVGGDGNLLLNVGPMPTGEIEPRQVERLKEIGVWMSKYGDTLYGTRGGPFITGTWGGSTHRDDTIYLHIINWGENNVFLLPKISKKIESYTVLTGGNATLHQTKDAIEIQMSAEHRDPLDTILELKLNGSADDIMPVALPLFSSLSSHKKAEASNVFQNNNLAYGPEKAFDDDLNTRWATDSGVSDVWLSVDLGKRISFNQIILQEEYDRVQAFELQYKKGEKWVSFLQGDTIGEKKILTFKPVTAQFVRLQIRKASDGPTLREFQIRNVKETKKNKGK